MANVTKIGLAKWAKINNKEDIYVTNGTTKKTFQTIFEFINPADTDDFIAEVQAAFDEFKASPKCKDKTFDKRYPASLGYTEKDGHTEFKFWTYSEYKAKDEATPATKKHIPVAVYGKGALSPEKSIGNGSKIQILYTLSPFWTSTKSFGVSLNMNKVLVRELVEFGGNDDNDMSEFGVTAEELCGFPSDGTPVVDDRDTFPEESIPF